MQQFLSSISFCLKNIGYLFILCLPVMTLEIALVSLIASLDIESSSDTAALEAIGEISAQVFTFGAGIPYSFGCFKRRLHGSLSFIVY